MAAGGWAPERRRQGGAREHNNGDDEMVLRFKPAPPCLQARPTPVAGLREKKLASFQHNTTNQNIINSGPTQLLLGQLLCCVGSPQGPLYGAPGASLRGHFGEPFCFKCTMWYGQECGVANVGSGTYMWLKIVLLRRTPKREAQRRNTKDGSLWGACLAKAGRPLATCEEKRRAPRGARVPYADEIIVYFAGGAGLRPSRTKQGEAGRSKKGKPVTQHNKLSL